MSPLSYDECSDEEKAMRDFAAECAEEEMRDMGIDDDEFIACTLEEIRDGHSVEIAVSK